MRNSKKQSSHFRVAAAALCVLAAGSGCGQFLLTLHDEDFRTCMQKEQRFPVGFGGLSRHPLNGELAVIVNNGVHGTDKYFPGVGVIVGPDGKRQYPSTPVQSGIMQSARTCYLKTIPIGP